MRRRPLVSSRSAASTDEAFARREPYFSSLASERYLSVHLTDDRLEEFFASGERIVGWLFETIELRLQQEFAPMSAFEFGCGVGRLTIPTAKRVGVVTAADTSPALLEVARREAARRGAGHVEFVEAERLFAERRTFDFVYSFHTLQRLPQRRGLALLARLLGLVGPGGIAAFQVPIRANIPRWHRSARWLRARLPLVNTAANALLKKPLDQPFEDTHTYDIDEVVRTIEARVGGPMHVHLVVDPGEKVDSAIVLLQAPFERSAADGRTPERRSGSLAAEVVDVRHRIAQTSLEDLNRAAEEYFASLTDWRFHLAKPFHNPDETPNLLIDTATLLQGLALTPGMTVLEFGAGSGWLSRFLTQLGCRVILLDVSPTALQMARQLYSIHPVIGERPEPAFLEFDGRRIDLPDASVDRVIVFHALHHTVNPDDVIGEFGRILKPGGIVGCAEPGPRHSRRASSQFEMRTHGVVENDIDIRSIWRVAQQSGFSDLQLAVFHAPKFHVSLSQYEDLLAGGAATEEWLTATRGFLRHVRTFFLHKGGADTRGRPPAGELRAAIAASLADTSPAAGGTFEIAVTVRNVGRATWPPAGASGGVWLGAHVYSAAGVLQAFDRCRQRLTDPPRPIPPGETLAVRLTMPPLDAGEYIIEVDCVADQVAWFAQVGSPPVRVPVVVRGPRAI